MPLSKFDRLQLFFDQLNAAPTAGTEAEAFDLVCQLLNRVEDQHSGVPANPTSWEADGRLYPPQPDKRKSFAPRATIIRYRSRDHYLWIEANGAILITDIDYPPKIMLSKAGADGRSIGSPPKWMLS